MIRPGMVLFGASFLSGALAFAVWAALEIGSLARSLREAAPFVETSSGVLALPLLSLALGAVGALVLVEAVSRPLAERLAAPFLAVLFVSTVCAVVLGATGAIWNGFLMDRFGYHYCETRSGTRTSWTLWSLTPDGCAALPDA